MERTGSRATSGMPLTVHQTAAIALDVHWSWGCFDFFRRNFFGQGLCSGVDTALRRDVQELILNLAEGDTAAATGLAAQRKCKAPWWAFYSPREVTHPSGRGPRSQARSRCFPI